MDEKIEAATLVDDAAEDAFDNNESEFEEEFIDKEILDDDQEELYQDDEEIHEEPLDEEEHHSLELKDPTTVTDEELDKIADTAIEVLQSIFEYFDTDSLTIDEYIGDENELILDVNGNDLGILIGRHGKTLEALHVIVTSICFQKLGFRFPIVIDIEGYKSRLRQKIESIAQSTARRAVAQHRVIHLRPMSAFERRIVHIALRNNKKVKTESDGRGVERHVVIMPV